jgi:hypothetical protein
MNPYASYLDGLDPFEVLQQTEGELQRLTRMLGWQGIDERPAPGKWTAREIVCHLADAEIVFAFRLRQTLAEDHHVIQPFSQDRWAENYTAFDVDGALATFAAIREWDLALLRSLPSDVLTKPLTHPERGAMTFEVLIQTMAGHDLNHLAQIEAIGAALGAM